MAFFTWRVVPAQRLWSPEGESFSPKKRKTPHGGNLKTQEPEGNVKDRPKSDKKNARKQKDRSKSSPEKPEGKGKTKIQPKNSAKTKIRHQERYQKIRKKSQVTHKCLQTQPTKK